MLPSDLQIALSEPEPNLRNVLACPQVTRYARSKNYQLMRYLESHVKDMVKMVFSEDKSIEASRAFNLLTLGDTQISQLMLENDMFRDNALEALVKPDVPSYILGRLSSLTLSLLQTIPDQAVESCGFIYHLLKHCANPSIFNFFTTIVSDDLKFEKTQKWLLGFGFNEYLMRELQSIDFTYNAQGANPFFDPVYDKLVCLYQLIGKCASNSILAKAFKTNDVVDVLLNEIQNAPDFVRNARWGAINSVVCTGVAVECLKLIPGALQIITEPFTHLRAFRVSALDFLTQMMEIAPMTYELLLQSSVLQTMCTVLVQFPNSSILHGSFRKFVEIGLKNEVFAIKMVSVYTPLFVDQASGRSNRVLSATLFNIMQMFDATSQYRPAIRAVLREIPEYSVFMKKECQPYMTIINTPYGGSAVNSIMSVFKGLFD